MLKVAVQASGGYQGEFSIHPVGLNIQEKFETFKSMTNMILREDIANGNISVMECQLYGSVMDDPTSQQKATAQLRYSLPTLLTRKTLIQLSYYQGIYTGFNCRDGKQGNTACYEQPTLWFSWNNT